MLSIPTRFSYFSLVRFSKVYSRWDSKYCISWSGAADDKPWQKNRSLPSFLSITYENMGKWTKNRRKVPSSRQGLLAIGDTHHEACCSFAARCFHGLRLDLGVSTKPESTQMRKSNTHMTPDQSSPAEVWHAQGKSRQEKQLRNNASLQPALQPQP